MNYEPAYNRLPLASVPKRIASFALDFWGCVFLGKLVEALLGVSAAWGLFVFALVWLGDRVVVAGNNQGQSLGRWLLSLKTVDMIYGKSAGMADLLKRELFVYPALALLLAAAKSPTSAAIFAFLPLLVDIAFAIADSRKAQTLHDKIGRTIVVITRRGFQLDQKLQKLLSRIGTIPSPKSLRRNYQEDFDDYYNMPRKTTKRRPRR